MIQLKEQFESVKKIDTTIRPTDMAIDHMIANMGANETGQQLTRKLTARNAVVRAINEIGQYRLVNLTQTWKQATVAFAFYCGVHQGPQGKKGGVVLKIIPESFHGRNNVMCHLPSISKKTIRGHDKISGEDFSFIIKTYPWLPSSSPLTPEEMKNLKDRLHTYGLKFTNGDDHPGNIRRLNDDARTPIGIDSNMFEFTNGKPPESLINQWLEYVHLSYPVYGEYSIPEQTEETDFSLKTFPSQEHPWASFTDFLEEKRKPEKSEIKKTWLERTFHLNMQRPFIHS